MEAFGVKYCRYVVGFALNMEAEYWSETSLHYYQPARLYSPEYANMHHIVTEFAFFLQVAILEYIADNVTCC